MTPVCHSHLFRAKEQGVISLSSFHLLSGRHGKRFEIRRFHHFGGGGTRDALREIDFFGSVRIFPHLASPLSLLAIQTREVETRELHAVQTGNAAFSAQNSHYVFHISFQKKIGAVSCPNSVPRLSDWIPPPDAPKKRPKGQFRGRRDFGREEKGEPDPKACGGGRRQTGSDRLVFFSLCPSRPIERNTHSGLVPRKERMQRVQSCCRVDWDRQRF